MRSGIRVGTPSVTTQGMGVDQMKQIAQFISRAVRATSDMESKAVADDVAALVKQFPAYPRP